MCCDCVMVLALMCASMACYALYDLVCVFILSIFSCKFKAVKPTRRCYEGILNLEIFELDLRLVIIWSSFVSGTNLCN